LLSAHRKLLEELREEYDMQKRQLHAASVQLPVSPDGHTIQYHDGDDDWPRYDGLDGPVILPPSAALLPSRTLPQLDPLVPENVSRVKHLSSPPFMQPAPLHPTAMAVAASGGGPSPQRPLLQWESQPGMLASVSPPKEATKRKNGKSKEAAQVEGVRGHGSPRTSQMHEPNCCVSKKRRAVFCVAFTLLVLLVAFLILWHQPGHSIFGSDDDRQLVYPSKPNNSSSSSSRSSSSSSSTGAYKPHTSSTGAATIVPYPPPHDRSSSSSTGAAHIFSSSSSTGHLYLPDEATYSSSSTGSEQPQTPEQSTGQWQPPVETSTADGSTGEAAEWIPEPNFHSSSTASAELDASSSSSAAASPSAEASSSTAEPVYDVHAAAAASTGGNEFEMDESELAPSSAPLTPPQAPQASSTAAALSDQEPTSSPLDPAVEVPVTPSEDTPAEIDTNATR
jgi:hypothetical protein